MSKITYIIVAGIKGLIKEGTYAVNEAKVTVSYPNAINVGFRVTLPRALSTLFQVTWDDLDHKDANNLRSKSFARELPLYKALDSIN